MDSRGIPSQPRRERRFGSRRGSELVEGTLIIIPFLALVFLIVDTSYGLFLKATLQNAAQSGVSFAILDTNNGLLNATINQVKYAALGNADGSSGLLNTSGANLVVNFYAPGNLTTPLGNNTTGANNYGNVIEVDVSYSFAPLAPIFRSGASIVLSASAAGVLTQNPAPSL